MLSLCLTDRPYYLFAGMPSKEKLRFIDSKEGLKEITRIEAHQPPAFASWFPANTNPQALDLLCKMLKFNPDDRISVEDALAHPYLKDFHGQMAEPSCDRLFDFDFEKRSSSGGGHEMEMTEAEVSLCFCSCACLCIYITCGFVRFSMALFTVQLFRST